MKKALIIVIIVTLTILAAEFLAAATHDSCTPGSFINLYKSNGNIAAGLKQQVFRNIYASGNVQYFNSASDLELQAGAVYMLPHKVLFFRLYGGTGLQMSRNEGFQYPYIVLGTDFLFFFSEAIYPLKSELGPKFRGGFSFHF